VKDVTQDNIVNVLLVVVPVCVGWLVRMKAKADKADMLEVIDTEIQDQLKPVKKKLREHSENITEIKICVTRIDTRMEEIFRALDSLPEAIQTETERLTKAVDRIQDKLEGKVDR